MELQRVLVLNNTYKTDDVIGVFASVEAMQMFIAKHYGGATFDNSEGSDSYYFDGLGFRATWQDVLTVASQDTRPRTISSLQFIKGGYAEKIANGECRVTVWDAEIFNIQQSNSDGYDWMIYDWKRYGNRSIDRILRGSVPVLDIEWLKFPQP
jgi:hypothetical protein